MSTIESLTLWNDGVKKMETKEYHDAINIFNKVPEKSSKILFNATICKVILGQTEESLKYVEEVLSRDEHMAVGYHLRGIINYKLKRLSEASTDFELAYSKLRGRNVIDYNQLGLRYKLYACEPLYNSGVSWGAQGRRPKAMDYLWQASRCKVETKHALIDKAIAAIDAGQAAEIMCLPFADMIYRPPKTKLANLQKKDYLGKAKVITAVDSSDDMPGFEAPRKMSLGLLQVNVSAVKTKSAPNSPVVKRRSKSPIIETQERTSLLNKVGEGAAKLKQMLPVGLKPSKSDSNLKDKDNTRKNSLPPPPNKPLPPPPNKPAPQPPASKLLARSGQRQSKPLPPRPQQEGEEYMYAEETNRLAERIERLRQNEKKSTDYNKNSCVKPSELIKSRMNSETPQVVISKVDDEAVNEKKRLCEESDEDAPPLPPRTHSIQKTAPTKPPGKSHSAEIHSVTLELTCNGSLSLQVAKDSSLRSLQNIACDKFNLEPGTIDLWYKRIQDEEYVCLANEEVMTTLWAGVKEKLSLWCFSKE